MDKLPSRVRRIVCKFAPSELGRAADGSSYDGCDLRRTPEEAQMKNAITKDGRSQRYALNQMETISPERGNNSRGEF